MSSKNISRRDFLRFSGVGAALLFGNSLNIFGMRSALFNSARTQMGPFEPDAEISITAVEKKVQILPGAQTRVWSYEGKLLSGSGVTVQDVPGSYLGPVIRVPTGKKLRIYFHNNLTEPSVIHPHGIRVPEDCDGAPMQAIGPGQTKVYEFPVIDRAGPYWFHPHPMDRTGYQVAMGLAGVLYVSDPDEERAVPGAGVGANDLPIILQDRIFTSDNQILFQPNMMFGYLGDRILVNGQADATFSLEPRAYRLRLLNGSNARTYKLAWSNGMPLQVIGSDGGLLPEAVTRSYVTLMPGERLDLWSDFSSLAGKPVVLQSLAFDAAFMGMGAGRGGGMGMGGMGMGSSLPNGAAFEVLTINVGKNASVNPKLGPLPEFPVRYTASNVPNFTSPRRFVLSMGPRMAWAINGRSYEMTAVAPDEKVYQDGTIAWEWVNNSPIAHPMHIHNVQFQVVQRLSPSSASYATVSQGLVDSGWKDTVLVWPGERVKVAMTFGPHRGMYMYHCHILEHEDMGMMRNYSIS